jgi:hypothetical protein
MDSMDDTSTQRPMTQLDDFRNGLAQLNRSISDLRVLLAQATTTLQESTTRAVEDRLAVRLHDTRLSTLENFRSRIQGQLALLALVVGIFGTVGVMQLFGVHF